MGMKYTRTTKQWNCPHCKTVVKRRTESDLDCLIWLTFLPITLIVFLYRYCTKKFGKHTKTGEEVIVCQNCGKLLVLSETFFSTSARLVCSNQDMMDMVEPVLELMKKEGIVYKVLDPKDNVVEDIKINYTNCRNGKSLLTEIYIKNQSFVVLCNEMEFEYSPVEYACLILKELEHTLTR